MIISQIGNAVGIEQPLQQSAQENQTDINSFAINFDGDLRANVTSEVRDVLWRGNQPGESDWFAGDPGQSEIKLGYNFADPEHPVGECEIRFVNAFGNRPFAFSSSLNGAFKKLYLNQTQNLVVHFDINLQIFRSFRNSWLRTSVVVAFQSDSDGKRLYFEQDIQDSVRARRAMPFVGGDVFEDVYTNIPRGSWVHLDVPFEDFIRTYGGFDSAKPFFDSPDSTFLESVYLVNECFGSGFVRYSIANWWITVEPLA